MGCRQRRRTNWHRVSSGRRDVLCHRVGRYRARHSRSPWRGGGFAIEHTLLGIFGALVAVIVVAVMFMTAEYRRGLIKVTLATSPPRGRVLAAKSVVIGSVSFLAGLTGSVAALLADEHLLRSNGNFIMPVSTLTEVRVVAGTAALTALTAILALAVGALLRSTAAAVTLVITVVGLPYLLENTVLPAGAADWVAVAVSMLRRRDA